MRDKTYRTEAIILARRSIGEADRLLTIFSKYQGKLKVIAKGIRRPTSRKRGSLELFNQVVVFLAKGKTFDILTEAEVKYNFNSWRGDLLKVGIAYHLAEVVNKLTREGQEAQRVYDLLSEAYQTLNNVGFWELHEFSLDFKRKVLEELGFLAVGRSVQDIDQYVEDLAQSSLKTKRFLRALS